MKKWFWLAVLLGSLTACSTFREVRDAPKPLASQVQDQPFAVSGRLAVNYQGKGHNAGFDWQHKPEQDAIIFKTPLGNAVASLLRETGGVYLQADGQTRWAPDVETLTERQLGWPLPLSGLIWWVRGHPAPQADYRYDADGTLWQQGWQIRLFRDAEQKNLPRRLELVRDDLTIRLVLSDWKQYQPLSVSDVTP